MRDEIYVGALFSDSFLVHYGVGHLQGGHSGRYPWGSGKRSKQSRHGAVGGSANLRNVMQTFINTQVDERQLADIKNKSRKLANLAAKGSYFWKLFCNAKAAKFAVNVIRYNPLYLTTPAGIPNAAILAYNGKQIADELFARLKTAELDRRLKIENGKIDKRTGFRLKTRDFSKEEDQENVNPLYKTRHGGRTHNCMLCTTTYDMRRRGYDVRAKSDAYGFDYTDVRRWYPKAKVYWVNPKRATIDGKYSKERYAEEVLKELKAQKNGARGNLMFSWHVPFVPPNLNGIGGHSVVYEVDNGTVVIRDCQSNKTYKDVAKYLKHCDNVEYVRLDNLRFNSKTIKECCE